MNDMKFVGVHMQVVLRIIADYKEMIMYTLLLLQKYLR